MKKPVFQHITEIAVYLFGLGDIIGFINSVANDSQFINYKAGILLIGIILLIWGILIIMIDKGMVKWVTKEGQTWKVKKLGFKTDILFFGLMIILAIQSGVDFYKSKRNVQTEQTAQSKPIAPVLHVKKPVFDAYSTAFKILILPWNRECLLEDKKYDIGYVLSRRLEELSKQRHINIQVRYVTDSIHSIIDADFARKLMYNQHADQVLYGSYSLSECEGGAPDKICFNYQTNPKQWQLKERHANERYVMSNLPHGLDDIRNGTGQEDIEYVIYWIAAMSVMRDQNFPKAVELFTSIKDYKDKAPVLFQISNCYHFMKDDANTKAFLGKALQLDPTHIEATVHYSGLLVKDGKTELASKQLARVLTYMPDDLSVLRDLVLFYRGIKDTAKSDMYLRKFLELTPDKPGSYKDLGYIYREVKNFSKSKEYYEKAIRECARHPYDNAVLGEAYMLTGDSLQAKPYFEQALALDPNYASALYNMGILFKREKNYSQAGHYLERAIKANPYNHEALLALGNNYRTINKNQEAVRYYEKALEISPNEIIALIDVAAIYMELNQFDKANKHLDKFVSYYPDSEEILNSAGNLCMSWKNFKQAEVYFKKILKLSPGHAGALYSLASVSGYQHKQANVIQYLSKALKLVPALKEYAKKDLAFEWLTEKKDFAVLIQ